MHLFLVSSNLKSCTIYVRFVFTLFDIRVTCIHYSQKVNA